MICGFIQYANIRDSYIISDSYISDYSRWIIKREKLPRSIKKYIRREKARIKREIFDVEEQKKKIEELYKQFKK